ncbi:MAG: hypothetical protein A2655_04795 [Candidatus Yanofskybacteria bacterium RIFCSPHIGHO2_01_FULL_43_42]|uniref:Short-chain dehydrogenase n=1 Tax=Candidatus Yanofskybacteria bacterium RIFCSPLOWO2_01_FULL_43_22 TaxID=1802695 RepID=A0A1F8GFL2_9BACT|nr:MAG: hypothetical protein A2655_04795 [Candidatus Yanofskybacteria bacterium RIFCSPHIGHO2_01_FULL_43_42]OGN12625.1 MAG: hypothetical protein A3D48_01170 [Candidatus Yanofskybacteria bacterium RIFCSPHIGHO2_02_FULL_43_17]OGN23249.1 MAG: hypothetical protein A3A13_03940 [Candidatus Yanofskybacteria bacterium RIFCSPLOWO2_01_FULL_43_22]
MNKVAIVTGSSSGIGKAIAALLLNLNYKVYGVSKSPSVFNNGNFIWVQADLTSENDLQRITKEIKDDSINILINNAGIAFEKGALAFTELEFRKIFDLNFKAPILFTQALKEKLNKGLVINISSVSDRLVGEFYALYCSSKAALNIYFDVVALEEKNMKIISILPSYVDTPLLRKLQENSKNFDWNLTMKPEQIAEFVGRVINDNEDLSSGAKVIVVSDSLKEDLEYNENLWGYNVNTKQLSKIK